MRECPNEPGVDCRKGPRKDGGCCLFPRVTPSRLRKEARQEEELGLHHAREAQRLRREANALERLRRK
jgi:hypothetical protein